MLSYAQKCGWVIDKTAAGHVKSNTGEAKLVLCYVRLSREAWSAWKARKR
jgi:hypothetical protein